MSHNKKLNLALIAGLLITLLVVIGGCYPATTPPEGTQGTGGGTSSYYMIGFLVLIFAMFYFLMIRPQRKRQKEQQQMMAGLKRGDKVITAGGIYGQIESVSEDSVVIKVESGTTLRVAKGSVTLRREQ